MLGHKQIFESAIVAGNKFFAADDARIRKVAGPVPESVASAELKFFAALLC
jgi:hypothetical protein